VSWINNDQTQTHNDEDGSDRFPALCGVVLCFFYCSSSSTSTNTALALLLVAPPTRVIAPSSGNMFKRKAKEKKNKGSHEEEEVAPLSINPFATEPPVIVEETAAYIEQHGSF
jgi:hypothetical protein